MATITLRLGDCVAVLTAMPDESVGAVVCDPPYDLTAVSHSTVDYPYDRNRPESVRKGFMGKEWDATGIAFSAEFWDEVFRVLRAGGKIKAFGGTRTFHRMAAAMERAGFGDLRLETWCYGSGFPKSLDISKAIDKRPGAVGHYLEIKKFLSDAIQKSNKTRSQIDAECGFSACDFARTTGSSPFTNIIPNARKWDIMKGVLHFDAQWDDAVKTVKTAERAVIGTGASGATAIWNSDGGMGRFDVTAPATPEAQTWDGWGTALKPAWEPVIVAKKPLV